MIASNGNTELLLNQHYLNIGSLCRVNVELTLCASWVLIANFTFYFSTAVNEKELIIFQAKKTKIVSLWVIFTISKGDRSRHVAKAVYYLFRLPSITSHPLSLPLLPLPHPLSTYGYTKNLYSEVVIDLFGLILAFLN